MADEQQQQQTPPQEPTAGRKIQPIRRRRAAPTTNDNPLRPGGYNQNNQRRAQPAQNPPLSTAPPPQPATPPIFNFPEASASKDGDASDTQRLSKKYRDLQAANEDLYEKTAEREQDNATLKERNEGQDAELKKLKQELANLRDTVDDLTKKNADIKKKAKTDEDAHKLTEAGAKSDRDRYERAEAEIEEKRGEAIKARQQIHRRDEELAELKATNVSLHQLVDAGDERDEQIQAAMQQNADAKLELEEVNAAFEHIFKELGKGLTVQDYMDHVREQETVRLQRKASEASLDRLIQQPEQQQRKSDRTVSKSSVAEELAGSGYRSGQEDDEDDESRPDEDPTLMSDLKMMADRGTSPMTDVMEDTSPVAAPPQPLGFSDITSVETPSVAPQPKDTANVGTDTIPFAFSKITTQDTAPISPPSRPPSLADIKIAPASPPSQPLTLSKIITQSTKPITLATTPKPVRIEIPTPYPVPVLQNHVPWYYTLLLLLALLIFGIASTSAWNERSLWLAANDLSRHRVVKLGMSSGSSWLTPWLLNLEDMIGVDRSLLG